MRIDPSERDVPQGAVDKSLLPGKCRRGSLAHNPQLAVLMRLPSGEVVVVVNRVEYPSAKDLRDAIAHPIPIGVRVAARHFHRGDVILALANLLS
jgi:hypothetical protein